jgi:large subunit ribosomal protein L21
MRLLNVAVSSTRPSKAVRLKLVDGEKVDVGTPTVTGARVSAKVVDHTKGPKVVVFRYRPKKRYRVKTGHRQQYTRLQVESILME